MRTLMLCCSVVWSALGMACAADAPQAAVRIEWERSVHDAFIRAIENTQPLVIVFVSNPSFRNAKGVNHSNALLEEFDHDEFQALGKAAVFVQCQFNHRKSTILDPEGLVIYQQLKLENCPTTCVIAPRTDLLYEVERIEGHVSAHELVPLLRKYFAQALDVDAQDQYLQKRAQPETHAAQPAVPEVEFNPYEPSLTELPRFEVPHPAVAGPNLRVLRALPGVFRVHAFGDVHLRFPANVEFLADEFDKAYRQAQAAGEVPEGLSSSDGKWLILARDPDSYLKPSQERMELDAENVEYGEGTGFAVSREGLFLTNRHVVELESTDRMSPECIAGLQPPDFESLLQKLVSQFGGLPSDNEFQPFILGRILTWYSFQCDQTAQFRRAEVSLALAEQNPQWNGPNDNLAFDLALEMTSKLFRLDTRQQTRLPVTVVARGGPDWATDVAILRLESPWTTGGLVCLPLADASRISTNSPIHSLGFPGFRYDAERMTIAEMMQVNVESGVVEFYEPGNSPGFTQLLRAQRLELTGDEQKLLLVSALIRPGSSGGPIVLEDGSVIGLNVCYRTRLNQDQAEVDRLNSMTPILSALQTKRDESLDMGVPIVAAQKLLADNHITLDTGPTTALWHEGLAKYAAGEVGEAEAIFREVAQRQVARRIEGKPYAPTSDTSKSILSHYVQDMLNRCQQSR